MMFGSIRHISWPCVLACVTTLGCQADELPVREARQITRVEGELRGVVDGNNAFAWAVYGELRTKEKGNLFFSPFSISAALGMTYAGARGETARQMREAMHIRVPDDAYHQALGALLSDLGGPHGRGYELSIANRLFGQEGFRFRDDFLSLTADAYGAPLEPVDFRGDPAGSRKRINDWVSEETRKRIPDLLPSDAISRMTRLVLANAIYFDGRWATAFDPAETRDLPFHVNADSAIAVPMMNRREGRYPYAWNDLVSAIELPYLDDELSLVALLPKERDGLSAVEEALTPEMVDQVVATLREFELDVSFPKLDISYELPLAQVLVDLGMTDAFDEAADFSGISSEHLHVSKAVHKAFLQVDEAGTKAAAATAIGAKAASAPPRFVANQPFLFFIRDRLTGTILFVGRVVDPTK